jgi:hypothetical protein
MVSPPVGAVASGKPCLDELGHIWFNTLASQQMPLEGSMICIQTQ